MATLQKQCQHCSQQFIIDEQDQAFYAKMDVPTPTFCWLCRAQRRLAFRNERFLFWRKSDFSGKDILAACPPDSYAKVYENDVWFSDQWDPMAFGQEVDFSRPFLEQLFELWKNVPVFRASVIYDENSGYSNNFTGFKNCYLCFNGNNSEDCAYCTTNNYSKECFDCSYIDRSELCYEGFFLTGCSRTIFSSHCESSFNLAFCKNLIGCNDCFGCVNLRNKQYHIFNKPYTKEEYHRKLQEFAVGSYSELCKLQEQVQAFWLQFPNKHMTGLKNANVSGEYIYNSKNVSYSYQVKEGENIRYCQNLMVPKTKDCYDYSVWGENNELVYETVTSGIGANNIKFCMECWPEVRDSEYCGYCGSSANLFGCVGLRSKKYCILNKQYDQEDYRVMVAKIKKHMDAMPYKDKKGRVYAYGEFFPIEFSPFAYNHTNAQDYFPMAKDQVKEHGFFWKDSEERDLAISKKAQELSDHISEVGQEILEDIIGCLHEGTCNHQCTKAFKIIPSELDFYRKMNVPLPRFCVNCRHAQRNSQRNPIALWKRTCGCAGKTSDGNGYTNVAEHFHKQDHCPNEMESAYEKSRKEIVYCEECYINEIG